MKAQKTDDRDAEAIAEAATRPTMRFVELKSEEQLGQSLHRVRSRLVTARTILINQLRAIVLELGLAIPKGRRALDDAFAEILVDPLDRISGRMRPLVGEMRAEWEALDGRIAALNQEFLERARADRVARRLVSIPGIGVLNATAFKRGRDLAAWLGLVPRQRTTGGRPKLLGITKRGNKYLRMLFIHGARAAMPWLAKTPTPLGGWLRGLMARAHRNIAIVALAKKLARIAWATLRRGSRFEPEWGAMTAEKGSRRSG